MIVKATKSFVGLVCMVKDDVKEIPEEIARDLLNCGYVVENKPTEKKKKAQPKK